MRFLCASFLAALLSLPGHAQTTTQTPGDLVWDRYAYDPFEPSETGLGLRLGLPESDLVVIRALCLTDGQRHAILATLSADLGAAVEGQSILVEFDGLTGGLPVVTGTATGIGAEFGITGAAVEFPTGDRLWDHLATTDSLRYRIRGQDTWSELPGAPTLFAAFRTDCAAGAGPSPDPTGEPTDPATTGLDCANLNALASSETGAPRDIRVTNRGSTAVQVIWFDLTGSQVVLGAVPPGNSATLGTDVGHLWMISDAVGTCLSLHDGSGDIDIPPTGPSLNTGK